VPLFERASLMRHIATLSIRLARLLKMEKVGHCLGGQGRTEDSRRCSSRCLPQLSGQRIIPHSMGDQPEWRSVSACDTQSFTQGRTQNPRITSRSAHSTYPSSIPPYLHADTIATTFLMNACTRNVAAFTTSLPSRSFVDPISRPHRSNISRNMSSATGETTHATQCKCPQHKVRDRTRFKHYREDFGALNTKGLHLNLHFDVLPERILTDCYGTYVHCIDEPLKVIRLDANDLEILEAALLPPGVVSRVSEKLAENDWASHALEIEQVKSRFINVPSSDIQVDKENQKINITLPVEIKKGEQFVLFTKTIARPTANILEGAYYDYTPEGRPQTIITQCQQYGFRRIAPTFDEMPSKMCYTVTIDASNEYTDLISNGDAAPDYCKEVDGLLLPVYHQVDPATVPKDVPADQAGNRIRMVYRNWRTPMATYLFFMGLGTYTTYTRELEYPDGTSITLRLYLLPNLVEPRHAVSALNSMHDSIMWIYLALGPEAMEHKAERERAFELIARREHLKAQLKPLARVYGQPIRTFDHDTKVPTVEVIDPAIYEGPAAVTDAAGRAKIEEELAQIRAELKELMKAWKITGYKYTATAYAELAMQNSLYGGMENTNVTTILASRIAPSSHMADGEIVYMEGVKAHEFYHNINGSEVTGQSPFEIWLNEAVTVIMQRKWEDRCFGADFMRLSQVNYAFMPVAGPLAVDASPNSMAIEPEGFNVTSELVSAMTYSKAPEFVRMLALVMGGEDKFHKGLHLYHTKFSHSNATTQDFLDCMQEVSGVDLSRMARGWLRRTGHPTVTYVSSYDEASKTYTVNFTQTGWEVHGDNDPWVIPIDWALVKDGKNIREGVYIFDEAKSTLTIQNVDVKPDFISVGRDWSFFGRIVNGNNDRAQIELQATSDPDAINRRFAYAQLADEERSRIIRALVNRDQSSDPHAGKAAELGEGEWVAKHVDYAVSQNYVDMHMKMLLDERLNPSTRALILTEDEATLTQELAHHYWPIADARIALLQAVFAQHAPRLIALLNRLDDPALYTGPHIKGMHQRALKRHVLAILAAGINYQPLLRSSIPTAESAKAVENLSLFDIAKRILRSELMSDKLIAFKLGLETPNGSQPHAAIVHEGTGIIPPLARLVPEALVQPSETRDFKELLKGIFNSHPDTVITYISATSSLNITNPVETIAELVREPFFKPELANHSRTVARWWSLNRKHSVYTHEGLKLTVELCISIAKVSDASAAPLLGAFCDIGKVDEATRKLMVNALKEIKAGVSHSTSLTNNINRILETVGARD